MNIASRPPLRRLLALDGLLRANRYPNATTAGAALEVHPRTIHRDLDFRPGARCWKTRLCGLHGLHVSRL